MELTKSERDVPAEQAFVNKALTSELRETLLNPNELTCIDIEARDNRQKNMKRLLVHCDALLKKDGIMSIKRNSWVKYADAMKKRVTKLSGSAIIDANTGKPVKSIEFAHRTCTNIAHAIGRILGSRQKYDPRCLPRYRQTFKMAIKEASKRLDINKIERRCPF